MFSSPIAHNLLPIARNPQHHGVAIRQIQREPHTKPRQRSTGMSTEDFRGEARALLNQLLDDAQTNPNRDMLLEVFVDEFTKLHGHFAHELLNDVINDARTRLDARLSPDPIRQTIATVQTTVQDLWKNIWGP
jgi:hypothetical protein